MTSHAMPAKPRSEMELFGAGETGFELANQFGNDRGLSRAIGTEESDPKSAATCLKAGVMHFQSLP